uniref:Exportin-4 n=1 Tax=Nicotiana sylvestris TaxID=4096 RepID=A0A1U7VNW9_NICSY|nr:PREDICTED: exportin-4 isoform X3 [Nicotiana sylvestris]
MHQNSGAADLAQLQATMQAIEFACTSIQMHMNPAAAEGTILSLSQSPRPYQACKYILENSQLANARFQAAGAIRDAALREWASLEIDDKRGLISFCFHSAIQYASSPEGYVQAKVASVAAQLIKRGWIEFSAAQKETFFLEVRQAIVGSHGLDVQFIGLNFLESLVSEFSPSTSTAMALPREFHEQCRVSFELEYLKMFYCWAQDAAVSVSNKIIESDSAIPEVKVCTTTLRLMLQILNWDFKYDTNMPDNAKRAIDVFSGGVRDDVSSSKRTECNLVQPGSSWRGILVSSGHIGWLLSFYGALRLKFSCEEYWLDCPLAVSARKLIVQFCSLSGTIFPSDDGNSQKQHLLHLLSGIIPWIDPPGAVSKSIENGKSESELLDGCRALLYMATVTTLLVFDELLKSIRPYGTLSLLSALMCEVIKDLMANHTEEETWSWVARDILLDTWTTLLMPLDGSISHAFIPSEGISAASHLFALIVESELRAASASAFSDENEADYLQASIAAMDERLSSYALIARAAINVTVPLLTRLFSEKFARLHQGRGFSDPTQTLEELYSLLLITGHVLADEVQGETPLVPNAIQTQFMDVTETDEHPVVILCGSIIKFAEQSLNPEMRASFFSPRLMEAVVWFLARWSATYLMPPDESKESASSDNHKAKHHKKVLLNFCGEDNQGKAVLDLIIRIVMVALISYPGERDLQALTCHELLHGLVRRKNVCVHLLELESWRELANAFTNERTLVSLNAAHQRSLAQTLVLSASGMKIPEASSQYVRNLTNHMTAYLVELSSRSDLKHVAEQPDIILFVSCLLERLRGAASATEPRSQRAIYEMGYSVLNPLLTFMEVYKHEISLSISSSLRSEADTEQYKDLRALLQLLASLCSKDLVDFSSEPIEFEAHGTNICQVVYTGLHIVTPLISLDLLKYPKLCLDYFSLLSHMLEVYPEMVTQLNGEAFVHIIASLDFGLCQDAEVVDLCLRAIKGLASFHYKQKCAGKVGLGHHASGYKDHTGNFQEGILSQFLRSLLQFLLFQDYSTDLVGSAADALLPLILSEQSLYQKLGSELIKSQSDPAFRTRLTNALQSLTSSNNLSSTLDRPNYQKFRKNLHNFLTEVRGFLRKI